MNSLSPLPHTGATDTFQPTASGECLHRIWDRDRIPDRRTGRIEFPALIRFQDHWYCAFREGEIHNNHPSGRGRLIRSADAIHWETVRIFDWDGGDVREPKFSVTAEGRLMINTSVYFVSRTPREARPVSDAQTASSYTPPEAHKPNDTADAYYQLDWIGGVLNLPDHDREPHATQQSVTWLSDNGVDWDSACAPPAGLNTWLWSATWHNGMGYCLAEWGKHPNGALYRTRDGRDWRLLRDNLFPEGQGGEGALAFDPDGTAYCLLRGGNQTPVFIGVGKGPYYQDWTWAVPEIDYGPADGGPRPAAEVLDTGLGGPVLIRLRDGRLVGAGRALGPNRNDGRATLFLVDPGRNRLTKVVEFDGTSYPGIVEHDGRIWVTYLDRACHEDRWEVMLAAVSLRRIQTPPHNAG